MNTRGLLDSYVADHQRKLSPLPTPGRQWIDPKLRRRAQAQRDEMYAAVRALTVQWHLARERAIRRATTKGR